MTDAPARGRELSLYREYFELVGGGTKSIEVRVKYPHLEDLAAGDTTRFRIKSTDESCDVRVSRVTEHKSFEALLEGEGPAGVNPGASRDQQPANICCICGPEKEALGAPAVEIRLPTAQGTWPSALADVAPSGRE
ncbi:ASCH domain-containing protein [Streptomyces sp. NPDC050523]|uniref:ASCH domain-containing protein n=1 Tax=Streptomyces sp. NPDC050523 TaxID=3365622 RepID=UPI0037A6D3B1